MAHDRPSIGREALDSLSKVSLSKASNPALSGSIPAPLGASRAAAGTMPSAPKDARVACPLEASRGALLAAHAAAGLAAAGGMPTAARLLRAAEGLLRTAAIVLAAPAPPSEAAGPPVARKRRRRPRGRGGRRKPMDVEAADGVAEPPGSLAAAAPPRAAPQPGRKRSAEKDLQEHAMPADDVGGGAGAGACDLDDDSWADGLVQASAAGAGAQSACKMAKVASEDVEAAAAEERAGLDATIRLKWGDLAAGILGTDGAKPSTRPVEYLRYWAACPR